jgi:OPA family sugar phosphate sensor protein UhpC-like MFS transporter
MVWLLAVVYFLLKPARYLILFWAPYYINKRLGTEALESGILGSMFELAGPLGMVLGGYLSDKFFRSRRMPVTVLSLVGAAVLVFVVPSLPATRAAIGLGFFGVGLFVYLPDSLISATSAIDFGTRRGASTAAGIINGCGSIGQLLGATLPGWIELVVGESDDIWGTIFRALGAALLLAAVLLLPQWHRLPTPASNAGAGAKGGTVA